MSMSNIFKNKFLAFVVLTFTLSIAQADDTGVLSVSVLDAKGNPVAGATVSAESSESLRKGNGVTDTDGSARIGFLSPSSKYVVKVTANGFVSSSSTNIRVVSGQTRALSFQLSTLSSSSNMEDIVVVSNRESLIDTTSAQQGLDITLDITESLPTGRSYQSYLQLAPSVKVSRYGNPSSKSGVNYSDVYGTVGNSTDNVYYIDGVNVTNVNSGTANSNLNSEIIQEQQVLTGGLSAEYEGGTGLVSKVITKSGGNEFSGSVNYYFQSDSLVGDNDHLPSNTFESYDTAVTLGGPIIKDKVWFFASVQQKENVVDVTDLLTNSVLRKSTSTADLGFVKITAQATDNDFLSYSFFNDPFDRDASSSATTLNNRDSASKQGGDNYNLTWTHGFDWNNAYLTVSQSSHEGESSALAAVKTTRNDVAYKTASEGTLVNRSKGGSGSDSTAVFSKDELAVTFEFSLASSFAGFDMDHDLKLGWLQTDNKRYTNSTYPGGENAQYNSIGANDAGTTYAELTDGTVVWSGAISVSSDDTSRIINLAPASFVTAYDADADGAVSAAELAVATFSSTAGNPHNDVNVYRIVMTESGAINLSSEGEAFFVQDTISINDWTFDVGFRGESYQHFSSEGTQIADFDWEWAPRLAATWDINGDGSSKVYGFFGRYYDPIRTDMTSFAGTLSGSVREEQVYLADQWITYRTRGGAKTQDALFAPTTKTPYTDEMILGYSQLFGSDKSVSVSYTERETRDIMEDFGLYVYSCPGGNGCPSYGKAMADGGYGIMGTSYGLPLSYFGYETYTDSNYVIGTLKGGKRDYTGIEITFRKRPTADQPFFILASYTNNDAKGNSNSDGNADLQGDFEWLDPRGPNMYSKQPGNIEHQFKLAGTYNITDSLEAGAVFNWSSGHLYNKATSVYGRYLPPQVVTAYEDKGLTTRWLAAPMASEQAPSYYTFDVRLKYTTQVMERDLELFVDIFNAFDNQATLDEMGLIAGDGTYDFGEANAWVAPRSFYLGARLNF